MSRKILRINADDFGRDKATTQGIVQAVAEGLIDSFSVMPGGEAFDPSTLRRLAGLYPEVKIGAHLALVDAPFLHPKTPVFPNSQGYPLSYREFLAWFAAGKISPGQVYREWQAQIEAMLGSLGPGASLHHLDGHQHLHVLPGLWPMALRLQKEHAVPVIRIPFEAHRDSLASPGLPAFPLGLGLQALAGWRRLRTSSRQSPEAFLGFRQSTCFTLAGYREALSHVLDQGRPCELMVHPVSEAEPAEGDTAYPPARRQELGELRKLQAWLRN